MRPLVSIKWRRIDPICRSYAVDSATSGEGFTRSIYCKPQVKEITRDGRSLKVFTGLVDQTTEYAGDTFVKAQMVMTYKHDLDFNALRKWVHGYVKKLNKQRQILSEKALQHLGVDLAVAHMICSLGGRVQFAGQDRWFFRYAGLPSELPKHYVGNLKLESIDLSGTNIVYEGFEFLPSLTHLRHLRLKRCMHVDDFCLSRVGRIHTLEMLDVSECPRLTSKGVATLSQLKNLKHLYIHNNPFMEDKELVCLMLEDHLPKLFIGGVNYLDALPEPSRREIVALIASGDKSDEQEDESSRELRTFV